MPPKKKTRKKTAKKAPAVKNHKVQDSHLPGYLMIAFGLLGLGINYNLIGGMNWAKAYPLLAVLFGIVALVKVVISKD